MTADIVKQIRKATRRRFTAEEKIRIVLEGLRGEIPITDLCRKEGIQSSIYYKWSKAFLDSGKKRGNYALDGPTSLCYDSFMESLSVSFPVVSDLLSTILSISLIAFLPKIFSIRSWSVSSNHCLIFFLEV